MKKKVIVVIVLVLIAAAVVASVLCATSRKGNTQTAQTSTTTEADSAIQTSKAYFNGFLKRYNNSMSELVRMVYDPQNVRADWLADGLCINFSKVESFNDVIAEDVSQLKFSDIMSEDEFSELKGNGTQSNFWFIYDTAKLNALFDAVYGKGKFTAQSLLGGEKADMITTKGYYLYNSLPDYAANYTYYVNYRSVEHIGNKIKLKVNLIFSVESDFNSECINVFEFNTQNTVCEIPLDSAKPSDYTYKSLKDEFGFDESKLNEFTVVLTETADGLRFETIEL